MNTETMIRESNYAEMMAQRAGKLWQQREEGFLQGKGNINLFWASITSAQHTKAIVIVNGRVESAWKYQELFYQFFQMGYDVYSFDHRGQGMSERLVSDKQIGHVEHFSDYVQDMSQLINHFSLEKYQRKFIVAHSMGGAIATRYLQAYPEHGFHGLVLSAPMFGINMSPLLKIIAPCYAYLLSTLSPTPLYISKNRAYNAKPFEENGLTSSRPRYHWFRTLYEVMPELKLGGPSARWVWESIKGAKACIRESQKISIPVLLLQGSLDKIVSNPAQHQFIDSITQVNNQVTLSIIEGGKHEVMFEKDELRDQALNSIASFFASTSRN